MPLRVGPTEAERHQVIVAIRSGKSFKDATALLRKDVEPDWFERNEQHLIDVAANGETKPAVAGDAAPATPEPAAPVKSVKK